MASIVAGQVRRPTSPAAALLLTLGIVALHFTGMTAATITPDPTVALPTAAMEPGTLVIGVTAITMLILSFSLAGAILDEHLSSRSAQEASRLAASEARFRQLTDATFEGILMHSDGKVADANAAMAQLMPPGRCPDRSQRRQPGQRDQHADPAQAHGIRHRGCLRDRA